MFNLKRYVSSWNIWHKLQQQWKGKNRQSKGKKIIMSQKCNQDQTNRFLTCTCKLFENTKKSKKKKVFLCTSLPNTLTCIYHRKVFHRANYKIGLLLRQFVEKSHFQ